ncbi:hypothetical protein E4U59_002446 [Claviceps monticola]|nr:hypothetical protein E4U59_002446 [Claviceps monticola]
MRLSWGLALSAALGAEAGRLVARQNFGSSSMAPLTTSSLGPVFTSSTPISTTPLAPISTTAMQGGDTTILATRTITLPDSGNIVTSTTTVFSSLLVTVTVTTTDIATTTVTSRDNETATKTVYVTSTQIVNAKRAVEEDLIYVGDGPAQVEAQATPVPAVLPPRADHSGLQRRALVTNFVTVTVGSGGGDSTVLVTATRVIKSATTTLVHTTSFVTETEQANAKTTLTTTATIILKLTQVSIGAVETSTSTPTGTPASSGNNGNKNDGNNDSGLSTGAKAGIGAGVGVAALAAIGALAFCFIRRHRNPRPDPDDLLGPSSEVPVGVGSTPGPRSRPMSQGLSSTPGVAPRRSPMLPNVQPEGYRGTAMGDGRAGYAKPETYGSSYGPTRSATTNTANSAWSHGDQLPSHPTPEPNNSSLVSPVTARPDTAELGNDGAGAKWVQTEAAEMATDNPAAAKWHADDAHEIDGQAITSHQSGPVYEMPTETYR